MLSVMSFNSLNIQKSAHSFTVYMKHFRSISLVLQGEKQRTEWSHPFFSLQHSSLPFLNSSQLTPRLADRRTVSLMCCCVCVLEGQSHRRVSVTPKTKRLGSLASCWGTEPWLAWSVKPCQMEPFQNNES